MKKIIEVIRANESDILKSAMESFPYSEKDWLRNFKRINDMMSNIQYYIEVNSVFSYPRYFVKYKLPEGFNVFTSFSMSSSLTNAGFLKVVISENSNNNLDVFTIEFEDGNGNKGRCENNTTARKYFAKLELTVTNDL
jgi:hypothetical protein